MIKSSKILIRKVTSNQPWLFIHLAKLLGVLYLLFLLSRFALMLTYPSDFDGLSILEILNSFWRGALLFDTSIILIFLAVPFLLSIIPNKITSSKWWLQGVTWYVFIIFCTFLFILIGDILYFGQVHRHVGHELKAIIQTDISLMVAMTFQSYAMQLSLFIILVFILFLVWKKVFHQIPHYSNTIQYHGNIRLPVIIFMFGLMLLGVRGSIVSKPITSVYAFESGNMAQGHLTLNGVFSTMHALVKPASRNISIMPIEEAKEEVVSMLSSSNESYPDKRYPLMRYRTSPLKKMATKPNIIILLLESWDAEHVDIMREVSGLPPFNVTPNFNNLAKKGMLFTNFYANGQRSIDGLSAILAGIPSIPGSGFMGEGIETNSLGWLGLLAKKQGYQTYMLQGSKRGSLYLDRIAPLAGFDKYYGSQNLGDSQHIGVIPPAWGSWDYDLLNKSHQVFEHAQEPFLGMIFTVSTHLPFDLPTDKNIWKKYPETTKKSRFLNSLYYADWALGEFIKKAKKSSYFKNTIFILTADHVSGLGENKSIRAQHHIPALIFGNGIKPQLNDKLGSQLDIIPTIIDIAGWSGLYASLGQSLSENTLGKGVFIARDSIIGRIENKAVLLHNLHNSVYYSGEAKHQKNIERKLLSSAQLLNTLLQKNMIIR